MTVALILDARADLYLADLQARFPDCQFVVAHDEVSLRAALAASPPDVGFGIGDNGFLKAGQRLVYEAPSLKWFQVGGSGFEQIQPFDRPDVTVTNCAGVLARFLAETVTGAILAINGNFFAYRQLQAERTWRLVSFSPLAGQTLLVVGLGAIGDHVARNARALGMRVIGIRGRPASHPDCEAVHGPDALDALLPEADFVSLHVRMSDATRHLINARTLGLMKPGAALINTARGGCVDTTALVAALEAGHLRAAYLDVFEQEPLPPESPLWAMPQVFMTPHASDMVHDWQERFAAFFADNLERWRAGQPLENVVAGGS